MLAGEFLELIKTVIVSQRIRLKTCENEDRIMLAGEFLELIKTVIVSNRIRLKTCEMLQRTDG